MAYCTLQDVRGWLGVGDAYDDVELSLAVNAACDAVDSHCGYPFSLDAAPATRVFVPASPVLLDLAAVGFTVSSSSGLIVRTDDDDDGAFEVTWAATDYQTEPLNGRGPGGATWPITQIRAIDRRWPVGGSGRARVQITGTFGWPAVPGRVRTAATMLAAAWHQRRMTVTGRSGFDGFFASAIADDQTIADLLAPFRHGTALTGVA